MTLPWKLVIALGIVLSLLATGFAVGVWVTKSIATNAAYEASKAAAAEIAKIQITNTTTVNKVREIIKYEKVYSECKHSEETLKVIKGAY